MKERVELERQKLRTEAREKAHTMLVNGDFSGATRKFIEGIEITPDMINAFILELRTLKVEFIVAPYEADAQLAYLYQQSLIDIVLTEDSDLLLFGASKCLFKMDLLGKGIEIDLSNLPKCEMFTGTVDHQQNLLLLACILSGCDYLESLKGIGFKKAIKMVQQYGPDIRSISKDLKLTGLHGNFDINLYVEDFDKAIMTFKH